MNMVMYDGSFEGLLTAIFEIYEYKITDPVIADENTGITNQFGGIHKSITNDEKAKRVEVKLKDKLSRNGYRQFHAAYLSEEKQMPGHLYRFARHVIDSKKQVEFDYSHRDVLYVQQTSRKVYRERHRMEAFIRFQQSADGLYFASIEPDFNVGPLLVNHFRERYKDQRWLIYDVRRKYGILYDLKTVEMVEIVESTQDRDGAAPALCLAPDEIIFQKLWQQYFTSVNIAARKNSKLHVQHMPKRYWRYLTEKW